MQITAFDLPAGDFVVVDPIPPLVIPPFDSISVRIRYTPTDTNIVNATLVARQSTPCIDSTLIPISGQGKLIQTGGATILIPITLSGRPGDKISIPIVLQEGRLIRESEAKTFRATVRFNGTMLYPIDARSKGEPRAKTTGGSGISAGTLVSSRIDGKDRVVTVEIANDPVPASPDTLGFIDVIVLLGNDTATTVTFDTLFWTDGEVNTVVTGGLFTLEGYCIVGGNRLIASAGEFGIKTVAPNPFNPSTEIIFETIEDGPTTLAIYDIYGRRVETLIDGESLPIGAHMRVWDATIFPSGIYHAVLISPTERSLIRLVLAK
jgi:hypothetical protein